MASSNAIATTGNGSLAVADALTEQLSSLKTTGFENVTSEDMALVRLVVLQSNSPQCDKKKEQYIPEVSEGQLFNTVSKKGYNSIQVIPVGFRKSYIEWVPQTAGGGFVGSYTTGHPRTSQAQKVGTKLILDNGNELVETAEHYVLVLDPDASPYLALLSLSSSQLKHSRRWISDMSSKVISLPSGEAVRAPMFYQKYTLKTGVESNTKGAWHGLTGINFDGYIDEKMLAMAKEAADQFSVAAAASSAAYEQAHPVASQAVVDAVTSSME